MGDLGLANNPKLLSTLTSMLAAGHTQSEVADAIGYSRPTVCQVANRPDTKILIQQAHDALINQSLNQSVANINAVISATPEYLTTKDDPRLTLGLKYSAEVLRSVGILASQQQSVLIQQIYNVNTQDLHPGVQALLGNLSQQFQAGDILDAEVVPVGIEPDPTAVTSDNAPNNLTGDD